MNKRKIFIISLILLFGVGIFLYVFLPSRPSPSFRPHLDKGSEFLKFKDKRAVSEFELALKGAQNNNQKAIAQINLGVAYTEIDENPERGLKLLKDISLNESLLPYYRAIAINHILQYYTVNLDIESGKRLIFSGPVWSTFWEEGFPPYYVNELAVRKAYEWSANIFSTSLK